MIQVSILQESYTDRPAQPDESLTGQALCREMEVYKQAILRPQLELARQAIQRGVDLLVFREDINGAGNYCHRVDRPDLFEALAETIPGPTSETLAELARTGNCYVEGCFVENLDGKFYNTALLLDPHGKVAGKYHKVQLPPLERFLVTPGDSLPVFQTEIGRIGMLICYDMMTPEVCRCLALEGADVLIWPSLGYGWWEESGDFTVRSRAHDNQVYILGALPANSCIVDPYGDFIAQGGADRLAIVRSQIQPGADPLQPVLHHNAFLTSTPSLRERHLFERRPAIYQAITAAEPELVRRYPHTHMADLEKYPHETLNRWLEAQQTLTWQTREDKLTRP